LSTNEPSRFSLKTAKLQIESFGSALDLFYVDTGRYPTTEESLEALATFRRKIDVFANNDTNGCCRSVAQKERPRQGMWRGRYEESNMD
jgi:hypothetical protein